MKRVCLFATTAFVMLAGAAAIVEEARADTPDPKALCGEIPTPRWTSNDSSELGIEVPEELPTTIQERAYTSPIWYSPSKKP